ncbi:PREDICTED: lysosomal beta glucosidase-like [Nelumbo nucifera]|uniref:Lysosomal beta glucosidase-like n=1 Tax=Nelumbo nucifera TaxID=4432 RepID=A0A1U7ZWY1_NELNU|nr:PREDICTED: lysosomal beta glucosidase-like [Nelumbo nucifera]
MGWAQGVELKVFQTSLWAWLISLNPAKEYWELVLGTAILEGIKNAVSKQTQVVFEEKPDKEFLDKNRDYSYAIVVVGEHSYAQTSSDSKNLTLAVDGGETIKTVCAEIKCLVIMIEPYVDMIVALVAAWLPGSEAGKGIADVIFEGYDFQGRLPRT